MSSNGSSPRVRGTRATERRAALGGGSSPRVRGTRPSANMIGLYYRFIPAGAGNTSEREHDRPILPVHPRGCGEHSAAPRCASSAAVHPRGCGEHDDMTGNWRRINGSSPRVRGTPHRECAERRVSRFIPAGAGNTSQRVRRASREPVHPRGCGEHLGQFSEVFDYYGSSPRVRGTRLSSRKMRRIPRFIPAGAGNTPGDVERLTRQRFIPAGAGNTGGPAMSCLWSAVHPRGCGEHPAAM